MGLKFWHCFTAISCLLRYVALFCLVFPNLERVENGRIEIEVELEIDRIMIRWSISDERGFLSFFYRNEMLVSAMK